uniref:unspecific monooxygenase n=1 Tax=Chelonoidis abingdonii TaxID=106734 RepID=A0A8C0GIT2_CHEAB
NEPFQNILTNLVVFLVICISSLLFLLAWRKMSGSGKLPPGPVAFPIIEDTLLLNMKNLPNIAKYGPIFTIHLGSERVVVLCGYEIMKESLIGLGEEFSGRGSMPIFEKSTKGRGINFSNGEQWKQLRRFSLTNLRNFGMGKKSIEECIQEETCFLMERLRNTHGGDCFMSVGNRRVKDSCLSVFHYINCLVQTSYYSSHNCTYNNLC